MKSEKLAKWILNIPLILFLIVLVGFPAIYAIILSFQQNTLTGMDITKFVGFTNYLEVLKNDQFWQSLFFSLKYTLITTSIQLVLGFWLAVLFNRHFPGKRWLLSLLLLPIMIAPSLMGIMYKLLLNENIGLLTHIFSKLGIEVNLFSADSIVPLLIALDVIQWTPFVFLILYSAIQAIDKSMYEAAQLDGASGWKIIINIVLPVLTPIIMIVGFLRGIDAFRTFDVVYVLSGGGPGTTTTTVSIYLYKLAFNKGDFSLSSAASILIVLILFLTMPIFAKKIIRNS